MGLHLLPFWYGDIPDHIAESEGVANAMDKLHLCKIDMSDEIFIVNFDHYIGESTGREIDYSKERNKKLRWFTDDPIGKKVKEIIMEHNLEYGAVGDPSETLKFDEEDKNNQ